jgi:sarcosine oxidase subunit beta
MTKLRARADAVVVGGGTVGAWCAYFLRSAGLDSVVVVEQGVLGCGASSRAAGMVRGQGGTPVAVVLGRWTRDFYRQQSTLPGPDSGFVEQGYYLPAFTEQQRTEARQRMRMQQGLGLEVEWLDPAEAERRNPTLAPGSTLGGTFAARDGYLDPPRNVTAYAAALRAARVHVAEHTEVLALERGPGGEATGVVTSAGIISTDRVVLTGGPSLRAIASRAGVRVPVGGVRHQVAVTEQHPALSPDRLPMVFDVAAGIYWRPEDGGILFGMSNPAEPPGPARKVDWEYLEQMRARLGELVPVTSGLGLRKVWAATIDYTPDHLPILGPALDADGAAIPGVTVAAAGGHGMMWGPAVSRVAADLSLDGRTRLLDAADLSVDDLGLARFDEHGRSRLASDPIALPFPEDAVA